MADGVRFVVFAKTAGQWNEAGERDDEARALNHAREQALRDANDGAMVLREGPNRFGRTTRTTIYLKDKSQANTPDRQAIAGLETAARCETAEDLYAWPARRTLIRLFGRQFDRDTLTASEVLHLAPELDRLLANELIIAQAVLKIAELQTVGKAAETSARRDLLFDLIDEITIRARNATAVELPSPKGSGLIKLRAAAAAVRGAWTGDQLERVGVARDLAKLRNLWGKLGAVLDLIDVAVRDGSPLGVFDPFLADMLANDGLIEDMIGPRATTAELIGALLDLAEGKAPPPIGTKPSTQLLSGNAQRIAARLAKGDLPETASSIFERVLRLLKEAPQLGAAATGPEEEAAYRAVLRRVAAPERPLPGGGEMAEALLRHCLRIAKLGDEQADRGLRAVHHWLGEPGRVARFALALTTTRFAKSLPEPLDDILSRALDGSATLDALFPEVPPLPAFKAATNLHREVAATGLGIVTRKALCGRIEDLIEELFDRAKPIEGLLTASGPYHRKALAMVGMCQPDMLPPGRTLERARKTVVDHLRVTGYERTIAAEIKDPVQRELAHRDMLAAMRQGGFFS